MGASIESYTTGRGLFFFPFAFWDAEFRAAAKIRVDLETDDLLMELDIDTT